MRLVERARIGQQIRRCQAVQAARRAIAAGELLLMQRSSTGAGVARIGAQQIVRIESAAVQHRLVLAQLILQCARPSTARTVVGHRDVRHKRSELVFAVN